MVKTMISTSGNMFDSVPDMSVARRIMERDPNTIGGNTQGLFNAVGANIQ